MGFSESKAMLPASYKTVKWSRMLLERTVILTSFKAGLHHLPLPLAGEGRDGVRVKILIILICLSHIGDSRCVGGVTCSHAIRPCAVYYAVISQC